ncbi:106c7396-6a64-4e99-b99a-f465c11a58c3 [Sclerotinia trifoliorum]|uniref:106c7396-6a64-4e99-b99a-f465c11a58c3 n=1 Tax=Sclerotinia trifoliorum TaxID=28548 RepID=A0A8H2VWD1_9HELO|nr:106c7396-6a64-4e99-b99a-f465c11a58c3 [Sclerotinia trifoliorum]
MNMFLKCLFCCQKSKVRRACCTSALRLKQARLSHTVAILRSTRSFSSEVDNLSMAGAASYGEYRRNFTNTTSVLLRNMLWDWREQMIRFLAKCEDAT